MDFQPASAYAPEGYIGLSDFADRCGLNRTTITDMRQRGLFHGAIKVYGRHGRAWFIPEGTPRPVVEHKFGHPGMGLKHWDVTLWRVYGPSKTRKRCLGWLGGVV